MGARSALSVEQYLRTSFPGLDMEYRDGELVERSLPTYSHSRTQFRLLMFFAALSKALSLIPCPELRMKLRTGLYLIPDVAVFRGQEPPEVPEQPPLVVIEILSPDDRPGELLEKLAEYRAWGVAHVWVVNPMARQFFDYDGNLNEVPELRIAELGVVLQPSAIFE